VILIILWQNVTASEAVRTYGSCCKAARQGDTAEASAACTQVALQGIPDIRKVFIREAKRTVPDEAAPDGYANDTEWMLDTEGVNLLQVWLSSPASGRTTVAQARKVALMGWEGAGMLRERWKMGRFSRLLCVLVICAARAHRTPTGASCAL